MVKGTIALDAEWLLARLETLEREIQRIRTVAAKGVFVDKPKAKAALGRLNVNNKNTDAKPDTAMALDLDISGIEWKRSNRQGGGPAEPSDGWAWAFAYTQDGGVLRETMQLLQALDQYGTVIVGEYEISRGGRDGNLLNRKKLKKRGS